MSKRGRKKSPFKREYLSPTLRYQVLERDKSTCQKCGNKAPECRIAVDHIIPVAKGGKTVFSNLQVLCWTCNIGKGVRVYTGTFAQWLLAQAHREDWVGELATDSKIAKHFPAHGNPDDVADCLARYEACTEAKQALALATAEWIKETGSTWVHDEPEELKKLRRQVEALRAARKQPQE